MRAFLICLVALAAALSACAAGPREIALPAACQPPAAIADVDATIVRLPRRQLVTLYFLDPSLAGGFSMPAPARDVVQPGTGPIRLPRETVDTRTSVAETRPGRNGLVDIDATWTPPAAGQAGQGTIRLAADLQGDERARVLQHERCHAWLYSQGLDPYWHR